MRSSLLRTVRALFSSPASTSPPRGFGNSPACGTKDGPGLPPGSGQRPGVPAPRASCAGDEPTICGARVARSGLRDFICVYEPHTDGRHGYVHQDRWLDERQAARR